MFTVIEFVAKVLRALGAVVGFVMTGRIFTWGSDWLLAKKREIVIARLRSSNSNPELQAALAEAVKSDKAVKIGFQKFTPNGGRRRHIEFTPNPDEPSAEVKSRNTVLIGNEAKQAYEKQLGDFN
jgi:hypothetical protein